MFENACAAAVRLREVSSRDARSVAKSVTLSFQTPLATLKKKKKRLVTNLATSWTNFSDSLVVGSAATARDQHARSSFSALFSERLRGAARSVKRDIIALILHAIIAEITVQELSLSCLILCII